MSDFKSQLNQHCQKFRLPIPKYSTKSLSNLLSHIPKFTSSVQLQDGQVFECQGTFGSKKSAEQSAAEQALKSIKQSLSNTSTPIVSCVVAQEGITKTYSNEKAETETSMCPDSSTALSISAAQTEVNEVVSSPITNTPPLAVSKSLLNERSQKLHLPPPSYNSFIENGSFCSIVTFNNESYRSQGFHSQKKEAEKSAAQVALLAIESQSLTPQKSLEPGLTVSQSEPGGDKKQNTHYTPQSSCSSLLNSKPSTPQVISFKNVLQEYTQQRRTGESPKYSTVSVGR